MVYPATANILTVTNTNSSASFTGSLPWAVAQADAGGVPAVITFATASGQVFATPQTITLEGSLIVTNSNLAGIEGPSWGVTLAGDYSQSRFPLLNVEGGASLSIRFLSIGTPTPPGERRPGRSRRARRRANGRELPNLGSALSVTGGGTIDLGGQTVTADSLTLTDGSATDGTLSSGVRTVFSGTVSANLAPRQDRSRRRRHGGALRQE